MTSHAHPLPDVVHIARRGRESASEARDAVALASRGDIAGAGHKLLQSGLSAVRAFTGFGLLPPGAGEAADVTANVSKQYAKEAEKKATGKDQ